MAKTCWNVFVFLAGKNSVFSAGSPVLLNMAHLSAVMYEHVPVFEYSGCAWLMRIFVWWRSTHEEAVHQDSFHPLEGTGRALGGGDALYLICYRGWWRENCSLNVICTNQHLMVFKRIWLMKTRIKSYSSILRTKCIMYSMHIQSEYNQSISNKYKNDTILNKAKGKYIINTVIKQPYLPFISFLVNYADSHV